MNRQEYFEPTLFGSVRSHWRMVLAFAVVGVFVGMAVGTSVFNDWVAEASVLIETPEATRLFDQQSSVDPQRYTADQVAIIESANIAQAAISLVSSDFPEGTLTVDEMLDAREVTSDLESGLVVVQVVQGDPGLAEALATAVIDAYEQNREINAAAAFDAALSELDSRITEVEEELAAIQFEIDGFGEDSDTLRLDQQMQAAIEELLLLVEEEESQAADIQAIVERLQTLQLVRSVQAQDPALSSALARRTQASDRLTQLAVRRDQLVVDAALASTGVVLASPAREAEKSVGLARSAVFGLLVALVVGSATALYREQRLTRVVRRSDPAAVFGAPLLAEISDFRDERLTSTVPVRDAPLSAAAESFRIAAASLSNRLIRLEESDGRVGHSQVVVVTSAMLGDGKTVVSANLGGALAGRGRRILLIDADFGDPALTRTFLESGDNYVGLTDVVDEGASLVGAVEPIGIGEGSSFDLLTRGRQKVTAPDFFSSQGVDGFFALARTMYDLVLVDAPPLLQVAYSSTLVRLADVVLFVASHNQEVSAIEESMQRLDLAGTPLAGYVYNRSPLRSEMRAREGSMRDLLGLGGN